VKTHKSMTLGDHIKAGDLIEAHGETAALVLEVIPARGTQLTDRIMIMSDDGRVWKTRLEYTNWSVVNEAR
jgi:hypothetical protein